MFSKKNYEESANTVVGNGIRLEAAMLTGQESVKIDGEYVGDINLSGKLVIGDYGSVTGNIRAKFIEIAGSVKGNIYCDATVHLTSSAQVEGSIGTRILRTDEGASFNGQCRMLGERTAHLSETAPEDDISVIFDFEKLSDVYIPEYGPPVISEDN